MITAEEARGLLDGTTPGPWVQGWENDHSWVAFVAEDGAGTVQGWRVISSAGAPGFDANDAALIAVAPDLAGSVITLTEELAAEARERIEAERRLTERAEEAETDAERFRVEARRDAEDAGKLIRQVRELTAELAAARERENRIRERDQRIISMIRHGHAMEGWGTRAVMDIWEQLVGYPYPPDGAEPKRAEPGPVMIVQPCFICGDPDDHHGVPHSRATAPERGAG